MKKTLLIIITAFALVVSCKQKEVVGPAGANGTNGTNGTNGSDGNANVKTFLYTTKESDWTSNTDKTVWSCTINNVTNITKAVLDSGNVSVYYSGGNANNVPNGWTVLPSSSGLVLTFDYSYREKQVFLRYSNPSGSAIATPGVKDIKIVTATSTK